MTVNFEDTGRSSVGELIENMEELFYSESEEESILPITSRAKSENKQSRSFEVDEKSLEENVNEFLSKLKTPDYVHTLSFFQYYCEGDFKLYTNVLKMPLKDKIVIKHMYTENVFSEKFGQSMIKISLDGNSFLLQPLVWAILEKEKKLVIDGFTYVVNKLENPSVLVPEVNHIFYRYCIALVNDFKFCIDIVKNKKRNVSVPEMFDIKLKFVNQLTNEELCYNGKKYELTIPGESFIFFLEASRYMGLLLSNSTKVDYMNHHKICKTDSRDLYKKDSFLADLKLNLMTKQLY